MSDAEDATHVAHPHLLGPGWNPISLAPKSSSAFTKEGVRKAEDEPRRTDLRGITRRELHSDAGNPGPVDKVPVDEVPSRGR